MAGGLKGLTGQRGGVDLTNFDPRVIVIEAGHNPRSAEALRENIENLKPQILAANAVYSPIWARKDGERVILIDGESRLRATVELMAEGKLPEDFAIPTKYFKGMTTASERVLLALTANEGRPLERWELGVAYCKLYNGGMSVADVAAKLGKTVRFIRDCMELSEAGPELKAEMIAGTVSEGAVIQAVKKHGSAAITVINEKKAASPDGTVKREKRESGLMLAVGEVLNEADVELQMAEEESSGRVEYVSISIGAIRGLRKVVGR